jgi:hypothetical protein
VYGTDPVTGFAQVPWDNVGVQYGLMSVASGELTPEQFLEVNSEVGSWKDPHEMVEEGVPFEDQEVVIGNIAQKYGIPSDQVLGGLATGQIPFTELFDPWSSRNMNLAEADVVAPRRSGNLEAIKGAYASGLVFRGDLPREIPIIDARPYLEGVLDMHNSHQSFAARQRLVDGQGHHENQVIWFVGADGDDVPAGGAIVYAALDTIDEWLANLDVDPTLTVGEAAPTQAVDGCFDTAGDIIASGADVWSGILDDESAGPCTEEYPVYSTSRIEAGAPITGDIYKCRLMPVETAIVDGLYGEWTPTAGQTEQLSEIFPDGVCDYDLPGMGDPDASVPAAPHVRTAGPLVIVRAERGATVELRQDGDVVESKLARRSGIVIFFGISEGTYTARQIHGGNVGQRSAPFDVSRPGRH